MKIFKGWYLVAHLITISILLIVCIATREGKIEKPNIIVLLLDDAGYADFGFMGCQDLKTPNIDKLANNGIIFTDAHVSASVCGPSRAGLLFGRYQQRFGFECNPSSEKCGVDLNEVSLAMQLKKAGYTTSAFGKWHLGAEDGYRPNQRGFDYFWGFLSGGRSYFSNAVQDKPGHSHSVRENNEFVTFDGYLTDELGKSAVRFIDNNKDKPFFMYWAPNAVHTPLEATEKDLDKFKDHPRQMLAAMTWALDRAVGNIIKKLEEENLLDNTLIFFLSDNGGAHNNYSSNLPLKGFKGNKFEGGHRVPFFVHWPKKLKGGEKFNGLTSSLDIYATSLNVAGLSEKDLEIDGVSLIPYLKKEKQGQPHHKLFWRKDKFAAVRVDSMKMICAENIPSVLYNIKNDLGETHNLSDSLKNELSNLNNELQGWEKTLIKPLWTESAIWDSVTWYIHSDLMHNEKVRVKNPGMLKEHKQNFN